MTTETVLTDEQIEQGRHGTFSTSNPFCPCDSKTMRKAVRWAEQAVLQSSEIQALRKDAKLYRQLKQACSVNTEFTAPMNEGDPERWCVMRRKSGVISSFTGEQLDFAVRHIPSTPARPESEQ